MFDIKMEWSKIPRNNENNPGVYFNAILERILTYEEFNQWLVARSQAEIQSLQLGITHAHCADLPATSSSPQTRPQTARR